MGVGRRVLLLGLAASLAGGFARSGGDWPPAPPLAIAPDDRPGSLPQSVSAEPLDRGTWACTFRYRPPGTPRNVFLAGTFNQWNPTATPLRGPDPAGFWSARVELPAGVHEYKFVVDGDRWYADPDNPEGVSDGHNGLNSVLRLGRIAALKESDGRPGDGQIEGLALEHRPERPLYFQRLDGRALFRLRTLAHDLERVWVAVRGQPEVEMTPILESEPFTMWEAIARLPDCSGQPDCQPRYTFVLLDGQRRVSVPEDYGVSVSPEEVFQTPDWAKHAIWYQIMLDRFRNGNPANDRQPVRAWTSEWFTPAPWEGQDGQTFYKYYVFDRQYGGDLDGLEEKLPYLKDLGVNALYLMPIFKAESNHKYNTTNYLHVDDHFGTRGDYDAVAAREDLLDPSTWEWTETDRRFLRFLRSAHAAGFRVIIDGVFNHVGTLHPAFQDVKKNGPHSTFADWFDVISWKPFRYRGWAGLESLPVFKKSSDGLASQTAKRHIFNVTRRWMDPDGDGDPSDGIDGWRLDVPNEIPAPFWAEWRTLVKSINPQAYITGEIWERADQWLDGKHFDGVMNYEFARVAVEWLFNRKLKISASQADHRLRVLRLAHPLAATLVQQNLLDSHDTDRVASMARNPDRPYDHANRVQDNGPGYDNAKPSPTEYARARLAALLQMTYVGAPMIYYGDEVGMWGADDPTCRKPMLWEDLEPYDQPEENFVMRDHLDYYRQIIALRNSHSALRIGGFQTLLTHDEQDVWAFLRRDDDEQLVVVLNASDQPRQVFVPLPTSAPGKWRGIFNSSGAFDAPQRRLQVQVPAISGVVLHAATPK